ncbi:MAG: hypothetical protein ACFCVE_08655 [Phycisphaerae bacterium]
MRFRYYTTPREHAMYQTNVALSRRFDLQQPAGYIDGQNLYQYASSGPAETVDPDGLQSKDRNARGPAATRERNRELNEWASDQRRKLRDSLEKLCPAGAFRSISNCDCTPDDCTAQAKELANAIVDAVKQRRRQHGDQWGGVNGNRGKRLTGNYDCGDWQVLIMATVNPIIEKHRKAGKACFNSVAIEATGARNHGVPNHQWIEIAIGNDSTKTVTVDPWPSGGNDDLINTTAIGGWPIVKKFPYFPFPPTALAPATQPNK